MAMIHMDERDLAHLMSVNHGAAITFVQDGAQFLRMKVEQRPIVEVIYPELPARTYAIDEKDLDKLLKHMHPRPLYRAGNVLRLSKPYNLQTVIG